MLHLDVRKGRHQDNREVHRQDTSEVHHRDTSKVHRRNMCEPTTQDNFEHSIQSGGEESSEDEPPDQFSMSLSTIARMMRTVTKVPGYVVPASLKLGHTDEDTTGFVKAR